MKAETLREAFVRELESHKVFAQDRIKLSGLDSHDMRLIDSYYTLALDAALTMFDRVSSEQDA